MFYELPPEPPAIVSVDPSFSKSEMRGFADDDYGSVVDITPEIVSGYYASRCGRPLSANEMTLIDQNHLGGWNIIVVARNEYHLVEGMLVGLDEGFTRFLVLFCDGIPTREILTEAENELMRLDHRVPLFRHYPGRYSHLFRGENITPNILQIDLERF